MREIIGEEPQLPIKNRKEKIKHLKNYIFKETAVMLEHSTENSIYDYQCYMGQRNSAIRHAYRKKVDTRKMVSIRMVKKPNALEILKKTPIVYKMNSIVNDFFQNKFESKSPGSQAK